MGMLRKVKCDCCKVEHIERQYGEANWGPGWIKIDGVVLNGTQGPMFCPNCTSKIMNYVDSLCGGIELVLPNKQVK